MSYENIQIVVDGVILPSPIDMSYGLEDLDADSERDTKTAILDRNVVRQNMFKVSLVYGIDDTVTISKVLKAITPKQFNVELFDIVNNKRTTKNMYASSKSLQFIVNNGVWVKGFKFNLVEV